MTMNVMVCVITVNAIIAWCSVRIWLFLRRSIKELGADSRVQPLSAQINVVLLWQALTPVVFELGPNLVYAFSNSFGLQSVSTTAMVSALFNWAPLVNALSIIVIVKPYRQAVWRAVRLGRGATGPARVVKVGVAPNGRSNYLDGGECVRMSTITRFDMSRIATNHTWMNQ